MDVLVVALLLVAAPDRRAHRLDDDDLAPAELALAVLAIALPPFSLGLRSPWHIQDSRLTGQSASRLTGRHSRPGALIGTRPMSAGKGYEAPGIAGSGAIATGLAAVSTTTADTILLARSEASAWRAEEKVVAACAKIEGAEPSRLRVTTDPKDLADCDVVVEAIDRGGRAQGRAASTRSPKPVPTPTSPRRLPRSSIAEIAKAGGIAGRLFGLHVFNPVPRMKLVEVCFPDGGAEAPRAGACLVRRARQDRGRGSRPGRLRRQPPALPLPLRRRADDGAHRHGGR